jgi:hypothetical protein
MALFAVIYALLFAVWVYVMDHKIRSGPDEGPVSGEESPAGFVESAGTARRAPGASLTADETDREG